MKFINYFLITTFILSLLGCELIPTRKTQAYNDAEQNSQKMSKSKNVVGGCFENLYSL